MKKLVLIFLLIAASIVASEKIYYELENDNSTFKFTSAHPNKVHPYIADIAARMFKKPFSPAFVDLTQYDLTITENIIVKGDNLSQYDYYPKSPDRFRHVIWLKGDTPVKMEIYNTEGKIVFYGICIEDCLMGKIPELTEHSYDQLKSFKYAKESHTENESNILFSDGLNYFSVFRSKLAERNDTLPDLKTSYGTNVYSRNHGDYKYIVVGTVPHKLMEEVVLLFATDQIILHGKKQYIEPKK